ncbi:MAG: DUF3341 domain-containing protein [Pirellulaceae bacterium]
MSRRVFVGIFETEEDILGMAEASRKRGLKIIDIFAPYAVHGLDRAAGFRPSRLPIICFFLGLLGAALKVWFEFWTTAVSWPINVGGKPWNSWPAFIPITFEVMVLFAGIGTVIAFLIASRLYPGKQAKLAYPGVTDDRFAILLEEQDATFDVEEVTRLCRHFNATHVEERSEELD